MCAAGCFRAKEVGAINGNLPISSLSGKSDGMLSLLMMVAFMLSIACAGEGNGVDPLVVKGVGAGCGVEGGVMVCCWV